MIIDNEMLTNKAHNTGWTETYKYDNILEGIQERNLETVLKYSEFIIQFFEDNIHEDIHPFKEASFLTFMYWDWLRFDSSYYTEKDRVESYWNNRISVAGGSLPYSSSSYNPYNVFKENREEDNHILNLLMIVGEELEKDLDWKILPTPVKMFYCTLFVVNTFDQDKYFSGRHYNWINSPIYVEHYEGCKLYEISVGRMRIKDITADGMLKTFYCNSVFKRKPLKYANDLLKSHYTNEDIYSERYIPLFSEICDHLDEYGSLQGLRFNITSTRDNKVFDKDSYRKEMAEIERNVINSRFAAEKPIKDAEQDKRERGRRKQSRIRNNNIYDNQLIVVGVLLAIGCLIYPFVK